MSTAALQRVYVRMLFDPTLVERVHTNVDLALQDVELTAQEKAWLLACDRRLFTADPLRPRRTLKGLLEEFKASSALAVNASSRLSVLDAYFASSHFYDAIQHRGSLALSFGDHLASLAHLDSRIPPVAAIEKAIATARRGLVSAKKVAPFDSASAYRLSPHVAIARVPSNALHVMQAVEQVLFEISLAPVAALADDGPNLDQIPAVHGDEVTLLAVRGEGDHVSLEELPEGLADLLALASRTTSGGHLLEAATQAGADASTLDGLLQDRLLAMA